MFSMAFRCHAMHMDLSRSPSVHHQVCHKLARNMHARTPQCASLPDDAAARSANLGAQSAMKRRHPSSGDSSSSSSKRQPRHKQGRSMTVPQAQAITTAINGAFTLSRVQQLVQRHSSQLQHDHVSALLSKLVAFSLADPAMWHRPVAQAAGGGKQSRRHKGQPADAAMPLPIDDEEGTWEFSTGRGGDSAEADGEDAWLAHMERQRRSAAAAASSSGRGHPSRGSAADSTGQGRAAAAKQLGLVVEAVAQIACDRPMQFQLQTAAATLDALARLGYRDGSRVRRLLDSTVPLLDAAEAPGPGQAGALAGAAGGGGQLQGDQVEPATVVSMVQACMAMKVQPSGLWLQGVERATAATLRAMQASDLCCVVFALGTMGHQPSAAWLGACCSASDRQLGACQPEQLAHIIDGFASMRFLPDDQWMQQLLAATAPALKHLGGAELTRTLSALAALGCKPDDDWMRAFFAAVDALPQQNGSVLSAQQLTAVVCALARLGCRPDSSWMNECLMRSRRCLPAAGACHLAQLISGLSLLRFRASDAWVQHFLSAAFARLPFATPQQCCCIVRALTQLGQVPQGMWLEELAVRVQGRLGLFSCQQLAGMASSLAKLGFRPSEDWLAEWERCSGSKLEGCSSDDLAAMAWALAEMGHHPQVSWLYSFTLATYDRLDSFGAVQLAQLFEALPRVSPHPTWLDELVQICAAEASPAMRSRGGTWDEEAELQLQGGGEARLLAAATTVSAAAQQQLSQEQRFQLQRDSDDLQSGSMIANTRHSSSCSTGSLCIGGGCSAMGTSGSVPPPCLA